MILTRKVEFDLALVPGTTAIATISGSLPDRLYTLNRSSDLANLAPVTGQVDVPGNGGELELEDSNPLANRGFYTVTVRKP